MSVDQPWEPYHPSELPRLFDGLACPWWIAGGWALELFAGRPIRQHADLDVEIPRDGLGELSRVLAGWEFYLARAGGLTLWDGDSEVAPPFSGLWCRPVGETVWRVQVMLATVRDGRWHYRRDERISRLLADVIVPGPDGLPLVAPEIQLLYKSRDPRPKDDDDFDALLELLSTEQRLWLAEVIDITGGSGAWQSRLRVASHSDIT